MDALFNIPATGAANIVQDREYSRPTTTTDGPAVAKARRTDPVTSHQAAQSVANQTEVQHAILEVLKHAGPLCDQEIIRAYIRSEYAASFPRQSDAGLRTRRAELVAKGMVRDSGTRVKLPSGRSSIVWEAT